MVRITLTDKEANVLCEILEDALGEISAAPVSEPVDVASQALRLAQCERIFDAVTDAVVACADEPDL